MNHHVQPIVIIGCKVCVTSIDYVLLKKIYNLNIIIINMTAQRMLWKK